MAIFMLCKMEVNMRKNIKLWAGLAALSFTAGNIQYFSPDFEIVAKAEENATCEEKNYTVDQLTVNAWDTATGDVQDGKLFMTFSEQYDQLVIKLPETIDLSSCESVTFYIEDQNIPLSFKLWNGENEIMADYEKSGSGEYTIFPSSSDTADAIGIMITDANPSDAKATFTGVKFVIKEKTKADIEYGIPDLKDSITNELCDITGACISLAGTNNETLMKLVTKHYNAITPENELKPDTILGGNAVSVDAGTAEIITFEGQELLVPKELHYDSAELMLDKIVDWNNEHPEDFIKARGHVLVWHSQTPNWFFYDNYDVSGELASIDTMNLRMEWYIKSVLEHFTGEDSKYKDLFYGWDVVNEAISDASGSYRRASENSMWAKVYGDENNEYIINAFKYANKYAPESLEVYYNDYNECVDFKCKGIVKLLTAVKEAEGTRISGMGMQAHHDLITPTGKQIEQCAKAYAEVVGKVQLTELDIKANGTYDGTEATRETAYTKMAYRYKEIYDALKNLKNDGIDVGGITFWGIVDKDSWLNNQASVGGGANGTDKQCPVLFDNDYKAKPAFWAFTDPSMLNPETKNVVMVQAAVDDFSKGIQYEIKGDNVSATFVSACTDNEVKFCVVVTDPTVDEDDCVTVYLDKEKAFAEGADVESLVTKRSDAMEISDGYQFDVSFSVEDIAVTREFGFDIKICDGKKEVSFNDSNNQQEKGSKNFARGIVKPAIDIAKGTVEVNGEMDDAWNDVKTVPLTINLGSAVSCDARLLWDEDNLYVYAQVKDTVLNSNSEDDYQQDSLEVFIDENNNKTEAYETDDKQYRINYMNKQSFNGEKCIADNVKSFAKETEDGYIIEAAFKWTEGTPEVYQSIGLELQINDADESNSRIGTLSWFDETGTGWSSPAVFGNALLVEKIEETAAVNPEDLTAEVSKPKKDEESNAIKYVIIALVLVLLGAAGFVIVKKNKKK